jgi:chromosome partitioning protein
MTVTIAVLSQKGGTGKTTTVRTIADVLRRSGVRTLAIDMDPQGNLSEYFDLPPEVEPTITDVLAGRSSAAEAIHEDIIPANLSLAETELALGGKMGRELTLRRALASTVADYEVVLIDCPPSLGLLTVNALTASDSVLIPLQCEYLALEGLTQLIGAIRLVQDHLNPGLRIEGVLLTMFDARLNLSQQVADEARKFFAERVYKTMIPRNVKLSEAPSFGKPIVLYDPHSTGAESYRELAKEVLDHA